MTPRMTSTSVRRPTAKKSGMAPSVRILAVRIELHAPAVDHRADGEIERHHGVAELGEVVALRPIEHDLEEPEPAPGELVATERVGAGPLLDGLAELAFELLALGLERLEAETGARLEQREDAVGVVAEGPAEVG